MENLYTCTWTDDKDDPFWDDFVATLPDGHYEQSTCWAKVRDAKGWQVLRLKIEKNGKILAGAQLLIRKIPYIPFLTVPVSPLVQIQINCCMNSWRK
jgi:lipid II:glycine glycyltransferase (peptidoglycan interpeptide bridge formation enzyme)